MVLTRSGCRTAGFSIRNSQSSDLGRDDLSASDCEKTREDHPVRNKQNWNKKGRYEPSRAEVTDDFRLAESVGQIDCAEDIEQPDRGNGQKNLVT